MTAPADNNATQPLNRLRRLGRYIGKHLNILAMSAGYASLAWSALGIATAADNKTDAPVVAAPADGKKACTEKRLRETFANLSRRVNLTGETGVMLHTPYGLNNDCTPFTLAYYEKWQSMLGRFESQSRDAYQSASYDFFIRTLRREIDESIRMDLEELAEAKRLGQTLPAISAPPPHLAQITQKDRSTGLHSFKTDTLDGRLELLMFAESAIEKNFSYTKDEDAFLQGDYAATPIEAFNRGNGGADLPHVNEGKMFGDCDDYTAAKYIILRELGFDDNDMYAVLVGPKSAKGPDHMVLMVNIQPDKTKTPEYITLDNARPNTLQSSENTDYTSYIAFSGNGTYVFPQALKQSGLADITRFKPRPMPLGETAKLPVTKAPAS